jgi:hypothetical protein
VYLLYLDASGDPGWPRPDGKSSNKWYVLAGLCLDESRWSSARNVARKLVEKYFSSPLPPSRELRYSALLAGAPPYDRLSPTDRERLTDEVFATLTALDPVLFGIAIDKAGHRQKYRERAIPPDSWAMQLLCPRFHKFLERKDGLGVLMMDAEERRKEGRLWKTVERGREEGIVIRAGPLAYPRTNTKLERLVENVLFLRSDSSDLIQIADCCSGAIWRNFELSESSRFTQIKPLFDHVGDTMYGLKTWP